jgi:hypothetical protein
MGRLSVNYHQTMRKSNKESSSSKEIRATGSLYYKTSVYQELSKSRSVKDAKSSIPSAGDLK